MQQKPLTRRAVLKGAAHAGLAAAATALLPTAAAEAAQRIVLDDASGLSPTPVAKHWIAQQSQRDTFVAALRAELKDAAASGRAVALSAARHSMGGQSLPRNGTAITTDIATIEPDAANKLVRVSAGARWHQIIATLDPMGWGPAVMQSNSDFGAASTFAVNAHGWPVPYGPFGSTVKSVELMLADGTIVTASREQESELFGLSMGGYGLVAAILSLDVEMVPNGLVKPVFSRMSADKIASRFMEVVSDGRTTMAYGRLDVTKRTFFEDALLIAYAPDPASAGKPIPKVDAGGSWLSRDIYRAQVGSEIGKRARWVAETRIGPKLSGSAVSRNELMSEPVANLATKDPKYRDILHEYFIPADRYGDFLTLCKALIPNSGQELLNITLRYVAADPTSRLAFAPTPRIANVMSFAQRLAPEAEAGMLKLTEALIEGVADMGGSFYLPYRLHARPDQVRRIYPGTEAFADAKRRLDPGLVFRNAMWDAYFA